MERILASWRFCALLLLVTLYVSVQTARAENPNSTPFLTSSISKRDFFVGEEILLTYTLNFKDVAPKIFSEVSPFFQGVWVKESPPERFIKSTPTKVQGKTFRSAVVKQFRLVPLQSGNIPISGYRMQCLVQKLETSANPKRVKERVISIAAPPLTLSARPLPEPIPENFSWAVGSFSFDLLADKQKVRAGEPLSLKMIITGTGSLHTLQLPTLNLPESFRHNPPERSSHYNKESRIPSGTITSTTITWPQSTGDFRIPAIRLTVFNPETEHYQTLLSKPLNITIARGVVKNIADQQTRHFPGESESNLYPPIMITAIFIGLLLLTMTATLLSRSKKRKKAGQRHHNSEPQHSQNTAKTAGEMKQKLFTTLDKTGIKQPGALTRRELENALQRININCEIRAEIPAVLDSLDKILYTPSAKLPESMINKVNTLIEALTKS
ncbi:MAG: BatD family protein [Chlorobium sp.]